MGRYFHYGNMREWGDVGPWMVAIENGSTTLRECHGLPWGFPE
jgi:hypothetical protein